MRTHCGVSGENRCFPGGQHTGYERRSGEQEGLARTVLSVVYTTNQDAPLP